jgi:hypothetical protein
MASQLSSRKWYGLSCIISPDSTGFSNYACALIEHLLLKDQGCPKMIRDVRLGRPHVLLLHRPLLEQLEVGHP